jgi:hypothetical protein
LIISYWFILLGLRDKDKQYVVYTLKAFVKSAKTASRGLLALSLAKLSSATILPL